MIYTSETVSLAALEVLVNYAEFPDNYALTEIRIPESSAIEYVVKEDLPMGWDNLTIGRETQDLGGRWILEARSLLVSVPSSIIRTERNILINPAHKDFGGVVFLPPEPFVFDERLK